VLSADHTDDGLVAALRSIDAEALGRHLATRIEYERAFPLFFRAVGRAVTERLWTRFPGAAAHVGDDCRSEAGLRYPHLVHLPLDWVAFSFPGVVVWDLHVGVVADLRRATPTISVGVHATPGVWTRLVPSLEAVDWTAAMGARLVFNDARVVGEKQMNEPARALDLRDLPGEVARLADRAARYYEIAAPLPVEIGLIAP
jgi:hypothetical protein